MRTVRLKWDVRAYTGMIRRLGVALALLQRTGPRTRQKPSAVLRQSSVTVKREKTRQEILAEAGVTDTKAVNRLLNQEIKKAVSSGLSVLYCIGEPSEDQERWKEVLKSRLIWFEGCGKRAGYHCL